jgi:hypothetical protein
MPGSITCSGGMLTIRVAENPKSLKSFAGRVISKKRTSPHSGKAVRKLHQMARPTVLSGALLFWKVMLVALVMGHINQKLLPASTHVKVEFDQGELMIASAPEPL